jgi:hypothetical protein
VGFRNESLSTLLSPPIYEPGASPHRHRLSHRASEAASAVAFSSRSLRSVARSSAFSAPRAAAAADRSRELADMWREVVETSSEPAETSRELEVEVDEEIEEKDDGAGAGGDERQPRRCTSRVPLWICSSCTRPVSVPNPSRIRPISVLYPWRSRCPCCVGGGPGDSCCILDVVNEASGRENETSLPSLATSTWTISETLASTCDRSGLGVQRAYRVYDFGCEVSDS